MAGSNKGIVPQVCDEVRHKTEMEAGGNVSLQVTFSMMEIYNEKISDLLNLTKANNDLKVRTNPTHPIPDPDPKTNNDLQVRTTPKGTHRNPEPTLTLAVTLTVAVTLT